MIEQKPNLKHWRSAILLFLKTGTAMSKTMQTTLAGLALGQSQHYRNLSLFPLFHQNGTGPAYLSLKEAIAQGFLEVEEVSESGSVPQLKAINKGELPILLADGEELEGAKQNRIVNTSLLLAAHSENLIPVSCTESGRWSYSSRRFSDSGVMMSSRARYRKASRVHDSLKSNRGYDAMQGEVWQDIEEVHRRSGSGSSRTRAMKDAFLEREEDMKAFLEAFPLQPGQNGMLLFLNGELIGMDYISRAEAYTHLHEKLIKSHAIEALAEEDRPDDDNTPLEVRATNFLHSLEKMEAEKHQPPVGLGTDYRFEGEEAAGAALEHEGAIVHLTAFNKNALGDRQAGLSRLARQEDRLQRQWAERRRRFEEAMQRSATPAAEKAPVK